MSSWPSSTGSTSWRVRRGPPCAMCGPTRTVASCRRIAARFVELVAANVFEPYGDRPFPKEDVPRLADLLRRLRPLAETTVDAYLARAMEQRMARELGAHYDRLMDHLGERTEAS